MARENVKAGTPAVPIPRKSLHGSVPSLPDLVQITYD